MNDTLNPHGKPCTICSIEYDDNEWGTLGYVGIIPVSFCVICTSAMYSMVIGSLDNEDLLRIIEERNEIYE